MAGLDVEIAKAGPRSDLPEESTPPARLSKPPRRTFPGCSLIVALGLFALLVVGRRLETPPLGLVVVLTGLPLLWLGTTAFVALWGAVSPPSLLRLGLVVGLLLTFLLTWVRAWVPWSQEIAQPIRVLSWNVQRLGFAGDGAERRCVSAGIQRLRPDLLILQEVSQKDVQLLSENGAWACVWTDYEGEGHVEDGGLAACGRAGRFVPRLSAPRRYVENVAWNYLFAEMVEQTNEPDPLVLNVLAVHLHPYHVQHSPKRAFDRSRVTRAQYQEANALIRRVAGLKDPTILAGDFNSTRDLPLHLGLRAHLADAHEKAGWGPGWTVRAFGSVPLKVDYVYVEPSIAVESATIPDIDCSDHRPVFAVVGLNE